MTAKSKKSYLENLDAGKADKAEHPKADDAWGVGRPNADGAIDAFIHFGCFLSLVN